MILYIELGNDSLAKITYWEHYPIDPQIYQRYNTLSHISFHSGKHVNPEISEEEKTELQYLLQMEISQDIWIDKILFINHTEKKLENRFFQISGSDLAKINTEIEKLKQQYKDSGKTMPLGETMSDY